jgi:hypothetical protein
MDALELPEPECYLLFPQSSTVLGDRTTAVQQTLDLFIGVQIPVPQPFIIAEE